MEIVISVSLGIWIMLAGFLCLASYKKDFANELKRNDETQKEDAK